MAKKTNIILPNDLTDEAQKFIDIIITTLKKSNQLENVDNASLYMLANACNAYIIASQHLKEEGFVVISDRGNQSVSPWHFIKNKEEKTIVTLLDQFGAMLKSRQKLKVVNDEVEESPLEIFLNSNK